jgi:hypothetical protein
MMPDNSPVMRVMGEVPLIRSSKLVDPKRNLQLSNGKMSINDAFLVSYADVKAVQKHHFLFSFLISRIALLCPELPSE